MYLHRGKKSLKINMFPIEKFRGKNSNEVEGMEEYDELENIKSESIKHRIWFFEN